MVSDGCGPHHNDFAIGVEGLTSEQPVGNRRVELLFPARRSVGVAVELRRGRMASGHVGARLGASRVSARVCLHARGFHVED